MRAFLLSLVMVLIVGPAAAAPRLLPPPPDASVLNASTGFFINHDGTILTAAHGVQACRRIDIGSDTMPAMTVRLVYADAVPDLAVLRADGAPVQNTLSLLPLTDPGTPLKAYGFPQSGRLLSLAQAQPTLLNDHVLPGQPADPRAVLWLRDSAITHGWSGGPVLDEATGRVAGMILLIAPGIQHLQALDQPERSVALALGAGTINTVLRRAGIAADPPPFVAAPVSSAVVRVFCWH